MTSESNDTPDFEVLRANMSDEATLLQQQGREGRTEPGHYLMSSGTQRQSRPTEMNQLRIEDIDVDEARKEMVAALFVKAVRKNLWHHPHLGSSSEPARACADEVLRGFVAEQLAPPAWEQGDILSLHDTLATQVEVVRNKLIEEYGLSESIARYVDDLSPELQILAGAARGVDDRLRAIEERS